MRAIGYFVLDQDSESSTGKFEEEFQDYCRAHRHQAGRCYFEQTNGSGSNRNGRNGLEFDRMRQDMLESKEISIVLVPDARHLGPDLESVARAMVEFEAMGAKVACMQKELPDPLQNALQTVGVKGVSLDRSARIRRAMEERAMQGKTLGRPLFGYRIGDGGSLEPVPEEGTVVELIYRLYTRDHLGLRLIAQHLNERNIPTRTGKNWNVVTIRNILKNPAYTGTYKRFGITVSGTHEAIIPRETFNVAQEQTRSRRPIGRVVNAEPFDLSKLVYCGHCGSRMMGATRRQSWNRKDGGRMSRVYRYYQCQSRNNQSVCKYHTWRAARLEAAVVSQLRFALKDRDQVGTDTEAHERLRERVRDLRQSRLENAERKLNLAQRRAAQGQIGMSVIGEYLKDLDKARAALEAPIEFDKAQDQLARWDKLEPTERRRFFEENVVRVDVIDDTVTVTV